ncbi:hypothetical protein [Lacticaseibacillus sp. 866-1]|uniref:hypothetical protein n=1 Tax=Lacticaseibacillus sp. 866-1 TaxID=2799576 RepID=UPI00194097E6|nr:hypothetical protein [Lacticaseibacillus sp. 866-1]
MVDYEKKYKDLSENIKALGHDDDDPVMQMLAKSDQYDPETDPEAQHRAAIASAQTGQNEAAVKRHILQIKDPMRRQQEIAKNIDLFK